MNDLLCRVCHIKGKDEYNYLIELQGDKSFKCNISEIEKYLGFSTATYDVRVWNETSTGRTEKTNFENKEPILGKFEPLNDFIQITPLPKEDITKRYIWIRNEIYIIYPFILFLSIISKFFVILILIYEYYKYEKGLKTYYFFVHDSAIMIEAEVVFFTLGIKLLAGYFFIFCLLGNRHNSIFTYFAIIIIGICESLIEKHRRLIDEQKKKNERARELLTDGLYRFIAYPYYSLELLKWLVICFLFSTLSPFIFFPILFKKTWQNAEEKFNQLNIKYKDEMPKIKGALWPKIFGDKDYIEEIMKKNFPPDFPRPPSDNLKKIN
jgi:protein-S-isoprenylcysteine O-methyltransferase Ste14